MSALPTTVEVLDNSLNVVTQLRSLEPLDNSGTVLQYSKELSDYGQLKLRLNARDDIWTQYGDIVAPMKYHIRLRKGTTIIWQGAIVANPKRNKQYIDVLAFEYEFYLSKVLVNRTSADPNGTGQTDVYRIFNSGGMNTAVTTILNETIPKFQNGSHPLKSLQLGTITNPNFPPNMASSYVGANNTTYPLTGGWQFGQETQASLGPTLLFDYHSIQYILKSFGIYAFADHQVVFDPTGTFLQFNFLPFIGRNMTSNIQFTFGDQGNVIDYQLPRLGQRMTNSLYGIATDPNGTILHVNPSDQASIANYGLLEDVAAFTDVKSQSLLQDRSSAELPLIATPDETNVVIYLNEKGYPLGVYDVGDLVTVNIKNKGVKFNQVRRIVGITVMENNTGREEIAVQTNIPQPWQYPNQNQGQNNN